MSDIVIKSNSNRLRLSETHDVNCTKRPEALDKGLFIISGIDTKGLLQSVELARESALNADCGVPVPDYTDLNVSAKVVRIMLNRTLCQVHFQKTHYLSFRHCLEMFPMI